MKLQTEVATTAKARDTIAKELETVKANLKQHIQGKRSSGGGGDTAGLEQELHETKEALETKNQEIDAMKKDLERRLGDSKQFRELKALLKKKTDEVKELKQQLSQAGALKDAGGGGG